MTDIDRVSITYARAAAHHGMPQASKRVAGRSMHGAAVRRPPDPDPPSRRILKGCQSKISVRILSSSE
jgi:hypothetical protein